MGNFNKPIYLERENRPDSRPQRSKVERGLDDLRLTVHAGHLGESVEFTAGPRPYSFVLKVKQPPLPRKTIYTAHLADEFVLWLFL